MFFHFYGLIIGIAIVTGLWVAEKWYKHWEGSDATIEKIAWWAVGGGILGARIYHLIDYWEFYVDNIWQIFAIWQGGLGIWGGIIGGVVGSLIGIRLEKLNHTIYSSAWNYFGASAIALPLAQAIGRIANLVNGEFGELVYGVPWWSLEMILNLVLFLFLLREGLRGRTPKEIAGKYLIGYGVIRIILESYRVRSWELGGISVASWIATISIMLGLWIWQKNVAD